MISLFTIVALGFLLGMRHATDPDHVIAVSTIVSHERDVKRAALIGAAWGAGHTLTILAVGSAMILFRFALPARLGLAMEGAVALMLIILGVRNLGALFRSATQPQIDATTSIAHHPLHSHSHGGRVQVRGNRPPHSPGKMRLGFLTRRCGEVIRPLVVGIVHGLAGSAAIALLVLSVIQSVRWAIVYLLVFGIGTIMGMMVITLTLASTFSFGQKRFVSIGRHFGVATGAISLIFGLVIAYQIGFVDGLFTGHAHWIPR